MKFTTGALPAILHSESEPHPENHEITAGRFSTFLSMRRPVVTEVLQVMRFRGKLIGTRLLDVDTAGACSIVPSSDAEPGERVQATMYSIEGSVPIADKQSSSVGSTK